MILTCPNCATQYVVKDGAIPPQGRQVRCASCKHSWHQEPEPVEILEAGPEMQPADEVTADESFVEATMIDPSSGPEAEERAYEEAALEEAATAEASSGHVAEEPREPEASDVQDYDAPPHAQPEPYDEFSPFADRGGAEPRRRGPLLTILLLVALIAALAAAFWFFAPPEWKTRLGLTESTTPLELSNPPHVERTHLASGNELLTVTGRVINPTTETHNVPPIYAQVRDQTGKVIYSWIIAPPAPSLAPGASASFNSAEVNVPSGGAGLTITLGQPKA